MKIYKQFKLSVGWIIYIVCIYIYITPFTVEMYYFVIMAHLIKQML
jgi:hypothetical protein